jgi:hypothetical protein
VSTSSDRTLSLAVCGQKCGPINVPAGTTVCPQCGHPLTTLLLTATGAATPAPGAALTSQGMPATPAPVDHAARIAEALEAAGFSPAEATAAGKDAVAEIEKRKLIVAGIAAAVVLRSAAPAPPPAIEPAADATQP